MTRQQDIFVHVLFLACAQPTPRMRKAKSQARCTRGRTARQEGVIRRQRVARAQQGRSRSAHLAAVVPNLGDAEKAAPELVERAPGFARVGGGDSLLRGHAPNLQRVRCQRRSSGSQKVKPLLRSSSPPFPNIRLAIKINFPCHSAGAQWLAILLKKYTSCMGTSILKLKAIVTEVCLDGHAGFLGIVYLRKDPPVLHRDRNGGVVQGKWAPLW